MEVNRDRQTSVELAQTMTGPVRQLSPGVAHPSPESGVPSPRQSKSIYRPTGDRPTTLPYLSEGKKTVELPHGHTIDVGSLQNAHLLDDTPGGADTSDGLGIIEDSSMATTVLAIFSIVVNVAVQGVCAYSMVSMSRNWAYGAAASMADGSHGGFHPAQYANSSALGHHDLYIPGRHLLLTWCVVVYCAILSIFMVVTEVKQMITVQEKEQKLSRGNRHCKQGALFFFWGVLLLLFPRDEVYGKATFGFLAFVFVGLAMIMLAVANFVVHCALRRRNASEE